VPHENFLKQTQIALKILMAVIMNSTVFWVVRLCRYEHVAFIFRVEEEAKQETIRNSWQAEQNQSAMHAPLGLPPASAGFLLGLIFDPGNGGNSPPETLCYPELFGVTNQKPVLFKFVFTLTDLLLIIT
jgi:hypothetical protein